MVLVEGGYVAQTANEAYRSCRNKAAEVFQEAVCAVRLGCVRAALVLGPAAALRWRRHSKQQDTRHELAAP